MHVLLADDQAEVRSALRFLLEQEPGMRVVGEAAEAEALLCQEEATQAELVLLDWELPGACAANLVSALRSRCPHTIVIALSGRPEARREALDAGADAFVSKGEPPEHLLAALYAFRDSDLLNHPAGGGVGAGEARPHTPTRRGGLEGSSAPPDLPGGTI